MPAFVLFATAIYEGGGLGKHSVDELRQVLAGRNASTSISIGEDAVTLSGRTTPEDLELQLQLMCAALTDPGYREEALRQFRKGVPMVLQQLRHTPAGPQAELEAWIHGNDPRFLPPTEALLGYEINSVRNWMTPILESGPIELSVVGDFDKDQLMPKLLATFGALPERGELVIADEARKVGFPAAPVTKQFEFDSKIPQAVAIVGWRSAGLRGNAREFRRLNLLASILSNRLREEIREKLGASYSPYAGVDGSEALIDFGYLLGYSVGKPDDVERLSGIAVELAAKLAADGATEDELDRARKPALTQIEKSLRENDYWLNTVMQRCQEDPDRIALARDRRGDYESITLEEINALAKKYCGADNARRVHIVPKENGGE
jgi:zinc protease